MKRLAILALAGALLSGPSQAQVPVDPGGRTSFSAAIVGTLTGAGSTFAFPLIGRWTQLYRTAKSDGADFVSPDIGVEYEPVGSLGGEVRVMQRAVDFGATDRPLSTEELRRTQMIQFPFVMGGIVPVVNLKGIRPGQLRLTGKVLAEIYLGTVKTWSAPAIKELNPELPLPDAEIRVIWRSDGSGTTYNWTDYLSRASTEWASRLGANTQLPWPVGTGAERTGGMVAAIGATRNSIGYVELGQVLRASLAYALVQNRSGAFVRPDAESLQAAAANADWTPANDFAVMLTDAAGAGSWPIVGTTFALVPRPLNARGREALSFFEIGFEKGGGAAAALGYVPLPEPLVRQIRNYWAGALQPGG